MLCALRMEIKREARHILHVADAEQADVDLRDRVALLDDAICADNYIASAPGAFHMIYGDNVRGCI